MPRSHLPVVQNGETNGCASCAYLPICGGMSGLDAELGCGTVQKCCGMPEHCDWVCPNNVEWFVQAWNDVVIPTPCELEGHVGLIGVNATNFPDYVPVIPHGGKRRRRFARPMVAVPLSRIFEFDRKDPKHLRMRTVVSTARDLRRRLRISDSAEIVVLSVGKDAFLEAFWHWHEARQFTETLAKLKVRAVSLPNFSAFDGAPRPHTRRNHWRSIRIGQKFAEARVPIIYHVNIDDPEKDIEFHVKILKANPSIRVICRELQTGNGTVQRAIDALNQLREIEERVGRTLHHVLVGAGFVVDIAKGLFPGRYTIVEQRPFMNTVMRHKFTIDNGRCRLEPNPSAPSEMLDNRLAHEVSTRAEYLSSRSPRPRIRGRQLLLKANHGVSENDKTLTFQVVKME